MNEMVFSIIIPVRNCHSYIGQAIESVQNQGIDVGIEMIVVDDGSTDDSGKIAASLGCTVISIAQSGAIKARNTGLRAAKGDFILFLDADDTLNSGTLQILYQPFEKDPGLQVVLALRQDFISPDLTGEEKKTITFKQEPYSGAIAGCALIRRQVFDIAGEFDESLQVTGDAMAWLLQLQKLGIKTQKMDFVSVNRRLHNNNMGRVDKTNQHEDYATILRRKLFKK